MLSEMTFEIQIRMTARGAWDRFEPDIGDDEWFENPSSEWPGRRSSSEVARFAEQQLRERLPVVFRYDGVRGVRIRVWSRGGPPDDEPDVVVTASDAEIRRARVEVTIANIEEDERRLADARAAMRRALAAMAFHRDGSKNELAAAVRPVWARRLVLAYPQGCERLDAIANALDSHESPARERDQLRFGDLLLELQANGTITAGIDWPMVDIELGLDVTSANASLRGLGNLGVQVVDDEGEPVTDVERLQPHSGNALTKVLVDETTLKQLRQSSKGPRWRQGWPPEPQSAAAPGEPA